MTITTDPTFDLVCVPGAIARGERAAHFLLGRRLFAKLVEERIDLPSGIALRLAADSFSEVARFVANERKCCPFLHIEIEIAPGAGPLWLRLTGPEGTRDLINAELGLAMGGSCGCATNTIGSRNMGNTSRTKSLAASAVAPASSQPAESRKTFKWAAAGGIVGALGIASCCLLPLVLLSLGFGGAWMGSFAVLTLFKPLFIAIAATLLGYGHYLVYFAPKKACAESGTCPKRGTTRWMKLVLWGATALALAGLGIEYVEPYLIG
jgi:mercuric ion transport protein